MASKLALIGCFPPFYRLPFSLAYFWLFLGENNSHEKANRMGSGYYSPHPRFI
jgi:hypothetical protein